MASSRRSGLLAAALVLYAFAVAAQTPAPLVLAGRVVRVRGADTSAVAGTVVVAHRVGARRQGPIDSVRSDRAGGFHFRVAAPDSETAYVVSTRHQGIGYFSEPFSALRRSGADSIALAVFDTSSTGPPLTVTIRHLVVAAPRGDGSREVLDIIQVANVGSTTRVAADSLAPSFRMPLPDALADFTVGESDVSASAIRLDGGRLAVSAPFPPGEKQIVVTYVLPRGRARLRLPIDRPTARLEVLVEDSTVAAAGLRFAEPMALEGRRFARFTADGLVAGAAPELRFGRRGGALRSYSWVAVVLAALALGAGGVLAGSRGRPRSARRTASTAALLSRIVALDQRYDGREALTPAQEWQAYRERRAALKAELTARLAKEERAPQIAVDN